MEKCKYCQAELAENGTFCPNCGKDNAEPDPEISMEDKGYTLPLSVAEPAAPAEETVATEEPAASAEEAAAPAEETKPAKKATPGKIALAVGAIVVLAAILVALIVTGLNDQKAEDGTVAAETTAAEETVVATVPADGNPDDETCKGTYTAADEEVIAAKDTVVAAIGDQQLTNGQLQVYYWSIVNSYLGSEYGYYVMMYGGLDYTQPLDTQLSYEDQTRTWQQYFLQESLEYWQMSQALSIEAEMAGMELTAEEQAYLDNLETSLQETAASYDMTLEELLLNNVGPGAGVEEFTYFQELYSKGNAFYKEEISSFVPTEEELETFFAEHEEQYASSGVTKEGKFVDVRHILIGLEGGTAGEDGVVTYSDEDWANAEAEAQAVLDEWLAGDKTEDSFAALANEKSEDAGSNTNGGLYQQVYEGQMVTAFNDWCFDEARQYGDYDIVKTEYGYHIMYFVASEPMWKYYTESDWVTEQTNRFVDQLVEDYPMEIAYEDIVLGYIDLGA